MASIWVIEYLEGDQWIPGADTSGRVEAFETDVEAAVNLPIDSHIPGNIQEYIRKPEEKP